jgi:hypothetical protein
MLPKPNGNDVSTYAEIPNVRLNWPFRNGRLGNTA